MPRTTTCRVKTPYAHQNPFFTLHYAVEEGYLEEMSQLLSRGANVNEPLRGSRKTPLHIAASEGTSLEVVKMLVEARAYVNRRDNCMNTALMYACHNGNDSIASYLLRNRADVNAHNIDGKTPLLFAIHATSLSVPLISALLKAKARINGRDKKGETPLHAIIARQGRLHDDAKWDVMKLLLSYPCNIDAKEKPSRSTPLHRVVRFDDLKSAMMLIKAGCKVDTKDHWNRVPMSHAIKDKLYPHVELLLAAGERIPPEDWMDIKSLLESEDPPMLKRLLAVGAECPKLSNMCRRAFYNHYRTKARNRIDELPLSPLIKKYLSYEIL